MSFFLRKRKKTDLRKVKPTSKNSKAKSDRLQLKGKENEELSEASDEEIASEDAGEDSNTSDSEKEAETAQEKRLRLTKEYLSQVEAEVDAAEDSDDGLDSRDMISKRLEYEARKQKGKHFAPLASTILKPSEKDISRLRGHKLSLTCLVVTPDDKHIFTGSKDCSIIKWDVALKKRVAIARGGRKNTEDTHKGHTAHVLCLAISSDGRFLVSGDSNNLILVWKPENLELIHTFHGHRGPITGLVFRRDTHQLYSASADRAVKVWTLDEMGYVETLIGHQDAIQGVDAHVRERVITCGGRDNSVRVWKIIEETQLVYNGLGGSIDCVCLVDEERFLTGSDTSQISVWHVAKKKPQCTIDNAHGNGGETWISALRCLKNTDLVASGANDGQIKLWKLFKDRTVPENICSVSMPGFINDLQFSSTGKFIAAAIGQEHKQGRWWKVKEAKNCLAIINLPRREVKTLNLQS